MPLKALNEGQPFYSWNLDESHRKLKFTCPHCVDELIPVIPQTDIIRHFRHKNNEAHGEPETPEHIAGKQLILNILKEFGIKAEPEVKVGWHICDICAEHDGSQTLFEYQCSPISTSEMADRARSYDCFHYWVLGTHYYNNTKCFRDWKNGKYQIQRITKAEREIGFMQPLLYLNSSNFYRSDWKFRKRAKVLGWYNLKQILPTFLKEAVINSLERGPFFTYNDIFERGLINGI